MKLPIPSYPLIGYAAAAALTLGFAGGFYVESLRWDHSLLKTVRVAIRTTQKQQNTIDKESTTYETGRTHESARHEDRQQRIRIIYQDREVAGQCAAPDDTVRVLSEAVDAANSRASGKPVPELPRSPTAPDTADRPRASSVGRDDDLALRRLRGTAPPDGSGVAEEPLNFDIPPIGFAA